MACPVDRLKKCGLHSALVTNKIHSGQLFQKESAARYFSVYMASGGLSQQEYTSRKRTSVGTRAEQKK